MKDTEFLILLLCGALFLNAFLCIGLVIWNQGFLRKRYELETDLLNTIWFKKHVPYVTYLPWFFSVTFYSVHILMCLWLWKFIKKGHGFEDLNNPKQVLGHFSNQEIIRVKLWGISGILMLILGFVAFLLMKLGY